ncbi:MAG: hypothetical protein ACLR8Y_08110 [Alistipes indistinctus]
MWGNLTFQPMKVEIDEKMLTEIAQMTGGQYFRATDNRKLREIYDQINDLEREPRRGGELHPLRRSASHLSRCWRCCWRWPGSCCGRPGFEAVAVGGRRTQ